MAYNYNIRVIFIIAKNVVRTRNDNGYTHVKRNLRFEGTQEAHGRSVAGWIYI